MKLLSKLIRYYISLLYWEHASMGAVKKMQLGKFRMIFEHARENSKFYNDLYTKHGVMNLAINSYEDIQKLPIITKNMLRKYDIEDIITCRMNDKINIHSTSGSTGEPFKIAYSKYEDYTAHVRLTREIVKHGYSPFKKMVLLSRYEPGHKFEVEEDIGILKKTQNTLNIFPKEVISIFEPLEDIIHKLQIIKPFIIWSTPSFIHLLAIELQKCKVKLNIPICFLMAETISTDKLNLFREYVCKNVIDAYGCMEAPSIGFSINSIGYKSVLPSATITEVINIRENGGGKIGDIIVTSLINKTMPFIRYDLGDFIGVIDDNESFPIKIIGKVHGRFEDIIKMEDGLTLSFHQTYQLFHDFHEVEQYKFLQLTDYSIVLQLRIKQGEDTHDVKRKAMDIWNKYFPSTAINIEFVDKFEIDKKTGKFKVLERKN